MPFEEFSPVTHVIFDLDGLLLDTELLYTLATQNVVAKYDKEYTWDLKVQCMGKKGDQASKLIVDNLCLPLTPSEFLKKFSEEQSKLMPSAKLLPESVPTYLWCYNAVLAQYNQSLSFDDLMSYMGYTSTESATHICEKLKLPLSAQELQKKVSSLYPQVFPSIPLMKGAEKLIRHLSAHGIPIAIASGCAEESFELKTKNHKDFIALFNHKVFASSDPEVKEGKPNPDIFFICARRFSDNPSPGKCLVFEDAPNGVQAAVSAGMQVVMVPDERLSHDLTKGASVVLKSLADFKPESFGLPAF